MDITTPTTPTIVDLQTNWHRLLDPDRARAVLALHAEGVSYPKLAAVLNCSPTLPRHLVKMLNADPEDLELAQHGLISTDECIRRGEHANARREATCVQAEEIKRAAKVAKVTGTILRWLNGDEAAGGNARQIVEEARFKLALAERTGGLPSPPPVGLKLSEIIKWARPTEESAEEVDVSRFGDWLVNWVVGALPYRSSRWEALDKAASRVSSTFWMRNIGKITHTK